MLSEDELIAGFSIAGVWTPVDGSYLTTTPYFPGNLASLFYGNLAFGSDQVQGLVVTGWAYDPGSAATFPVNIALFEQQPDGTLTLSTNDLVDSPQTNGSGSVVIADFNGDGRPDIFLAAHNETPFIAKASTVLLSDAQGGFDKLTLTDSVMAHDAELAMIDGIPTVVTRTFRPGDANPSYQFNASTGGFSETVEPNDTPSIPESNGQSIAVGDFNGDGKTGIALGDVTYGPGYAYSETNQPMILIYQYGSEGIQANSPAIITPYFND